jgi:very-short-patch-repair endonuclease
MSRRPSAETALNRPMGGKLRSRPSDRQIGALARRQHGVASRAQLTALGLGEDAIDDRLSTGRLHRLHRGVYAVGPIGVSREGRWMAAVLAGGAGAVLSHRSAAALWGVRRDDGCLEVAVPRKTRSRPAMRQHNTRFRADEVTVRKRIPVTTLARTLFDVAAALRPEALEAVLRESEYLHRFRLAELERLLERYPGRRGTATIKTCLRRLGRGPKGRTRSKLEERFALLLTESDLSPPSLNTILDLDGFKIEADCLWRDQRLIVELDGGDAHRTRAAFESDRERDRRLQAAGWRVIRVTWHQFDDRATLLRDLHQLLSSKPH